MRKIILKSIPNTLDARAFFDEYDIEYDVISRGENKGRIRVLGAREKDYYRHLETDEMFKAKGYTYPDVIDHEYIFRSREGNTIVVYCPYLDKEDANEIASEFGDVEVSDHVIYPGAVTIVRVIKD